MILFQLMMTNHNGQPVDFPGAQNASLPLPPAMDRTSQLMLPRDLLSSVLQMLVLKGGFNVDLTELAVSHLDKELSYFWPLFVDNRYERSDSGVDSRLQLGS